MIFGHAGADVGSDDRGVFMVFLEFFEEFLGDSLDVSWVGGDAFGGEEI